MPFESDEVYNYRIATLHELIREAKDTGSPVFVYRNIAYMTTSADSLLNRLAIRRKVAVEAERLSVEKQERIDAFRRSLGMV